MRPDLLLSLATLGGHFAVATWLLRRCSSLSPVLIHTLSSLAAGIVFVIVGWVIVQAPAFNVWPGLSILACGSMVFLFAYSAIYKSISLRLLVESAQAYPDSVSLEKLLRDAVLPRFKDRINLLLAGGQLEVKGDFLVVTNQSKQLCRKIDGIRAFLGFSRSGLYYSVSPDRAEQPK